MKHNILYHVIQGEFQIMYFTSLTQLSLVHLKGMQDPVHYKAGGTLIEHPCHIQFMISKCYRKSQAYLELHKCCTRKHLKFAS